MTRISSRARAALAVPAWPDEAETLPWQCFDEALFLAGIADHSLFVGTILLDHATTSAEAR
jgi:hypothetical protein